MRSVLMLCTALLIGATPLASMAADADGTSYSESHVWVKDHTEYNPDGSSTFIPGHWVITRTPIRERQESTTIVVQQAPPEIVEERPVVVYRDPPVYYDRPYYSSSVIIVGDDECDEGWHRGGYYEGCNREEHESHFHGGVVVGPRLPAPPLPPLPRVSHMQLPPPPSLPFLRHHH